ncbi:MAG: GFA family protein [Alphaproteobacteria bacterium]|nr:GFA family protein [Alphaproteobacteria bacterium]
MTSYTGGCACGAVRYEVSGEPFRAFNCHCRHCQQATGTGHASVVVFPRAAVKMTGETREFSRRADSGAQMVRGFCPSCGSPLYGKPQANPDYIGLFVGSLDDSIRFKPQAAIFTASAQPWDRLHPDLTAFAAKAG